MTGAAKSGPYYVVGSQADRSSTTRAFLNSWLTAFDRMPPMV